MPRATSVDWVSRLYRQTRNVLEQVRAELDELWRQRPDLHRHPAWQETFIVLEGRFDFEAAGERHSLGPGEMLVIPRGAAHGFACTSPDAGRLLTISTPARVFEAFVADISAANADPAADARAVFARHGFDLL